MVSRLDGPEDSGLIATLYFFFFSPLIIFMVGQLKLFCYLIVRDTFKLIYTLI
jgi:hypothetical protein